MFKRSFLGKRRLSENTETSFRLEFSKHRGILKYVRSIGQINLWDPCAPKKFQYYHIISDCGFLKRLPRMHRFHSNCIRPTFYFDQSYSISIIIFSNCDCVCFNGLSVPGNSGFVPFKLIHKYSLNRWLSLKVHHWATILRFLRTNFSGLHNLWQPGSRAERKWRDNEKMNMKWRENEEMERDSLSTFPPFLFISSLSIHFLYQKLSHFVAKC